MKKMLSGISTAAAALLFVSCASAPEKTVFIGNGEKLTHDDRVPAEKVWKDPAAVMSRYNRLIIKDVRTDLQLEKSWAERNGVSALLGSEDRELQELAVYMKNAFSSAIRNNRCRMELAEKPSPRTLTLELAIVKVVANKPVLETGVTVGSAFLHPVSLCLIPVRSVVSQETKSPLCAYLAIEGKVRDSMSGKELILFTMNSSEEAALLDLNKFVSPYANVREIIDRWSLQLVEVINKRPLETGDAVSDPQEERGYTLLKF